MDDDAPSSPDESPFNLCFVILILCWIAYVGVLFLPVGYEQDGSAIRGGVLLADLALTPFSGLGVFLFPLWIFFGLPMLVANLAMAFLPLVAGQAIESLAVGAGVAGLLVGASIVGMTVSSNVCHVVAGGYYVGCGAMLIAGITVALLSVVAFSE